MRKLEDDIRKYGGLISMSHLLYLGHWRELVRIAHMYGSIVRVRRGWYALPGEDEVVLRAWRVGGRLACSSALAYLRGDPEPEQLHVEVSANAAHLRHPDEPGCRLKATAAVILHWNRRQSGGDSRSVDAATAERQLRYCRWKRES